MAKSPKTEKTDFSFRPCGYGAYIVIYTSPVTYKQWRLTVTCMPLIDKILHVDEPLRKDLDELKWCVKSYGTEIFK